MSDTSHPHATGPQQLPQEVTARLRSTVLQGTGFGDPRTRTPIQIPAPPDRCLSPPHSEPHLTNGANRAPPPRALVPRAHSITGQPPLSRHGKAQAGQAPRPGCRGGGGSPVSLLKEALPSQECDTQSYRRPQPRRRRPCPHDSLQPHRHPGRGPGAPAACSRGSSYAVPPAWAVVSPMPGYLLLILHDQLKLPAGETVSGDNPP